MAVEVGEVAPDFTLRDQAKQEHTLSQYRGHKVVLLFYPFAFSGICTGELCAIRDRREEILDEDTVLLTVSCDAPQTQAAFAAKEGLTHALLSDFWPHGEVAQLYGVFEPAVGVALRATFVIDREGVVQYRVVNAIGDARDPDDYAKALAEIA